MDYISSQSTSNGLITITVIFKIGTDINTALMLTHNRVQDTLSRLPQDVQLQGVQVKKTIPALLLGVHPYSPDGSRSAEYISNYMILHVRDEIARLPGVADFWTLGERQYAMRIWIDPDKAAANSISASDILSALRAQNAQVSAGARSRSCLLVPAGDGADALDDLLPTLAHGIESRIVLRRDEAGMNKAKARSIFNPGKDPRDYSVQP